MAKLIGFLAAFIIVYGLDYWRTATLKRFEIERKKRIVSRKIKSKALKTFSLN